MRNSGDNAHLLARMKNSNWMGIKSIQLLGYNGQQYFLSRTSFHSCPTTLVHANSLLAAPILSEHWPNAKCKIEELTCANGIERIISCCFAGNEDVWTRQCCRANSHSPFECEAIQVCASIGIGPDCTQRKAAQPIVQQPTQRPTNNRCSFPRRVD